MRVELERKDLTAEEALRLTQEHRPPQPWELVDGELVFSSPAGGRHGRLVRILGARLGELVDAHRLGEVFAGDTGFVLQRGPDSVRGPDVAFVKKERLPAGPPLGFIEGAPDLAVEVRSPGDRWPEVLRKAGEYLAAGSTAVWVIDPEKGSAAVFSVDGVRDLEGDDSLEDPALLPGFSLRLRDLFGT